MHAKKVLKSVNKTANINLRIAPQTKSDLEDLFKSLGITMAQATNMFYAKALMVGGLPFDVRTPDYPPETIEALQETLDIEAGKISAKRYHSSQELFDANYAKIAEHA